jgi:dUTP pyrophosphatase
MIADDRLKHDLALAKASLDRIAEENLHSWEASAAFVALHAISQLEAVIRTAMDELNKEEPMKIKKESPNAQIPTLGSEGAGAFDCYAHESVTLYPGEQAKVPLGFRMEVPSNHVALLLPRSSTGSRGMHLANVCGVCDSDFRGQFIAFIRNNSDEPMLITRGDRICQMLIVPVWVPKLQVVEELSSTGRGEGSFGSTGR